MKRGKEKLKPPFSILCLHDREWIAGAEQSLLQLVSHLDRSRFLPFFVVSQEGEFAEALQRKNVEVFFLPFHPFKGFRWDRVFMTFRRLEGVVAKTKACLLHSNTPRTNLYAGFVGRRRRIPVIWHARNLIYGRMIDTDRFFSFLPHRIICNSKAIQDRFKTRGSCNSRFVTIYSGVDEKVFYPDEERARSLREELGCGESPLIGLVSRLGIGKGHETFIGAASQVHRVFPNARFLIVGRAENEEERLREKRLKDLVRRLNLSETVLFLGYRKDIQNVMAALTLLVVATEAEPFGRVILEALATGKPIVGTASGGTPEAVKEEENGLLVPPGDERAMAEAIARLLESPTEAKRMGERGRQKILSEFTLETHIRKIEDLYLSLIA